MIENSLKERFVEKFQHRVQFDVPMKRYTSLRVGGPADAMLWPENREELSEALRICAQHKIPVTVIGGGFNTIATDAGIDGVVLQLKKFRKLELESDSLLYAEAGVSHHRITKFCSEQGLGGLEFCAGIPGTVGGWLIMNAGIGEREIKDITHSIELMEPNGSEVRCLQRADLDFHYRHLAKLAPGTVLLAARFSVESRDTQRIQDEVHRLQTRRAATQPLDIPTCGSVFRNPPGDHAGRLIEAAGLKGEREGDAIISQIHANFVENRGKASATDLLVLIQRVQEIVAQKTGIQLEPEVRIVGREE